MRKFIRSSAALLAMFATGNVSLAATLEGVNGVVLVDRGTGFNRASSSTVLQPGERVVASASGSATIVYDPTCTLAVAPGSVVSVLEKSPCVQGSMQQTGGSLKDGPIGGAASIDAGVSAGPSGAHVALGVAALAAGGALVYWASKPSSP